MYSRGKLDERITIRTWAEIANPFGEPVRTPETFATVWANVQALSGREYFDAARVTSSVSHRVQLDYIAGVSPKMDVLWGSQTLEIEAVIVRDKRQREMELLCVLRDPVS